VLNVPERDCGPQRIHSRVGFVTFARGPSERNASEDGLRLTICSS